MKRILLTLFLFTAVSLQAEGFKVVVHRSNAISSISKAELSDYLLKKKTTWPDKKPVIAVDLTDKSPARGKLSQEVLGRSPAAIKSYWQQQIFSGREVPPVEKASDRDVVAFVQATPGAIGYVSDDTDTGDLKVVALR
jgi:ABC-type phosphate transport system substrate-binding protein